MAVIFRVYNSSIKAMLGLYPYQTWDLYTFPDWFNQAKDVTSQLDGATRTLVVLASIGEVNTRGVTPIGDLVYLCLRQFKI